MNSTRRKNPAIYLKDPGLHLPSAIFLVDSEVGKNKGDGGFLHPFFKGIEKVFHHALIDADPIALRLAHAFSGGKDVMRMHVGKTADQSVLAPIL